MLVCVLFVRICTRDRGCSAHPVFPAPSFEGREFEQSSGETSREIAKLCLRGYKEWIGSVKKSVKIKR